MTRIGTYPLEERGSMFVKVPPQNLVGTRWTEPTNTVKFSDTIILINQPNVPQCDIWQSLDTQARTVSASTYKFTQMFSQAIISPIHLLPFSSCTSQPHEQDVWIEMPPRSIKDVVMNVEYIGRGEPIDFFDEMLEE